MRKLLITALLLICPTLVFALNTTNADDGGMIIAAGNFGIGTSSGNTSPNNFIVAPAKLSVYNSGNFKDGTTESGIYSQGSVSIGTTDTTNALNVNGTVAATNFSGNGSGLTGVTFTQLQSDWTQTNGSSADFIKNKPGWTFSYPARSLNTCFQPSATKVSIVNYSVDIATTLSLSGGQTGTLFLNSYTNSSCTTGTQELARFVNGNTGTLTIGLNITQNVTGTLTGINPAGNYLMLLSQNTVGSPTFNYRSGEEVQYA